MADDAASGMSGLMMIAVGGAVALVVLSIVSLMGLALVGSVTDSIQSEGYDVVEPTVDEWVGYDIDGDDPEDVLVRDSRGHAIALQGSDDSYIESDATIDVGGDTWSVCTWASVDEASKDKTMTALSIGGELVIAYDGGADEWAAWYYQEDSRDSYRVAVDAPNQPGELSLVCAQNDGGTLSIHRNTTTGETADTTTDNIADGSLEASNWHGVLEETRTFNSSLNQSQHEQLHGSPTAPLADADRTARLYYDEGSGTTTSVFFADTTATIYGGEWVDGHEGIVLTEGTDYEINRDTQEIRVTDSLAGSAPAIWIDYVGDSRIGGLADSIGGGFTLLAMGAIVIPAVVVLAMLIGTVYLIRGTGFSLSSGNKRRRNRR